LHCQKDSDSGIGGFMVRTKTISEGGRAKTALESHGLVRGSMLSVRLFIMGTFLLLSCLFLTGCHTPAETAALTAGITAGVTATGAVSPVNEMEQVYYLGVFDPNEQVPTTIYRVRVHGQSSLLNGCRFASGWVPAKYIDSLGSQATLDPNGSEAVNIIAAAANQEADLQVGRRLRVFGPEGFRTIPADYRLTIVMSADPSKYFSAIDQMMGITAAANNAASGNGSALQGNMLQAYQQLLTTRELWQGVSAQP
jgi:hypothetical protein